MRRLKIAVDIDGVVSDFVATFVYIVKEKYNIDLTPGDIYVHDLFLVLGVMEKEVKELVIEALHRPIIPIPGAVDTLQRICQKHEIHLITARPPSTLEITKRWLSTYSIPYHSLVYLTEGNKHLAEQSFDIVIDDHLRELLSFSTKVQHLVVFDHPWNQTKNVRGLVRRVYSWKDIGDLIDKIASEREGIDVVAEKPQSNQPITPVESYSAAVRFRTNETRALSERTAAFLIVQSILVAAFVHIITIPETNTNQLFPYAFYPVTFGISIIGTLFCILYHVAGMMGSLAASRWRLYMQHIEIKQTDTPWNWFFTKTEIGYEKRLLGRLPFPIAWLCSPALFFMVWGCAIIYLILRLMPQIGFPWLSPITLVISILIFVFYIVPIILRFIWWWKKTIL